MFNGGNLVLQNGGTFTDGGQRLQVIGDTLLRGSGATSATNGLLIQNSASANIFNFRNDGTQLLSVVAGQSLPVFIIAQRVTATNQNAYIRLLRYGNTDDANQAADFLGFYNASNLTGFRFQNGLGTGGGVTFNFIAAANIVSSNVVTINQTFNPTSGTDTITQLLVSPTINQTGGANGITRGLYVNPTLTAAADWRSIEWSNSTGWGLYGAGTANNYLAGDTYIGTTTTSATKLTIGGSETAVSAIARGELNNTTLIASANNDVLVGLDVTPTFTNGAFTGVTNLAARFGSSIQLSNAGGSSIQNNTGIPVISVSPSGLTFNSGASGAFMRFLPFQGASYSLYMFSNGNVGINSSGTDAGFRLDVNGTARVSGGLTVIKNQNLTTISNVTNTTSGNLSQSIFEAISSNGKCQFGKTSAGYSAFKTLLANDAYLYNVTSGNISILNDFSTGNINFAAGGVSTAQMTLTASGRLLLGTVSELTYVLDVNGGTARMNGSSTSRSGLEVGTMNHQFFATNNAFIAENAFYNGSAFQRVNTGFSSVAYFAGGGFQVGTLPSGSAGTTQASLNQRFFLTNSGTLAISDTISGGGNITLVASAVLQVDSTTKGFLPPRMTTTQKNAIGTPAAGLIVYDTDTNKLCCYNGTSWNDLF
jgi:hypothetical protein